MSRLCSSVILRFTVFQSMSYHHVCSSVISRLCSSVISRFTVFQCHFTTSVFQCHVMFHCVPVSCYVCVLVSYHVSLSSSQCHITTSVSVPVSCHVCVPVSYHVSLYSGQCHITTSVFQCHITLHCASSVVSRFTVFQCHITTSVFQCHVTFQCCSVISPCLCSSAVISPGLCSCVIPHFTVFRPVSYHHVCVPVSYHASLCSSLSYHHVCAPVPSLTI